MKSDSVGIQRPRKWPRNVVIALAILGGLYFFITSSFFLRRFVLPQVEKSIGSRLEVGDLRLSPFRSLELRQVKLTPNGGETLAQIELIRVRYSLFALLGGTIQAHEVTVENPVITLVENADGTRNLPKVEPSKSDGSPAKLDLHQVQLRNGAFSFIQRGAAGPIFSVKLNELQVTADSLVTGQPGKISIRGLPSMTRTAADRVSGQLRGDFTVTPGPDALPQLLKGSLALDIREALGTYRDAAGMTLAVESDVTEKAIQELKLAFRNAGQELGSLKLSGPYDAKKPEARLDYELSGLDRRALVLLGGSLGVDLGNTSASAKGKIQLLEAGQLIGSQGELQVNKLSLGSGADRTPETDLRLGYKVETRPTDNAALVELLQLSARDAQGEWLTGGLDRPMNVAWGNAPAGFREARFTAKLARLRLADWRVLLGTNAPTGIVRADVAVTAERDGRLLKYNVSGLAEQLQAQVAGSQLRDGTFEFTGNGTFADFVAVNLEMFGFKLKHAGQSLTVGDLAADWHLKNQVGGAQVSLEGEVSPLLGLFPVPGLEAQSGRVKLNGRASQKETGANANLTLNLQGLNGRVQTAALSDYNATVQLDVNKLLDVVAVQQFRLSAGTGTAPGGTIDATGKWDLQKRSGNFDYQISGLNQSALESWLAPILAPQRLQTIKIAGSGKAQINLSGDSSLASQIELAEFTVRDPAGKSIGPIKLAVDLEAIGRETRMELKRGVLQLGATETAKNEIQISGLIDLSTNNPTPSTLRLESAALDLTSWYQMLTAGGPGKASSTLPSSEVPRVEIEPEPIVLPLQRLTVDLDFQRVVLGSLLAERWKGQADWDRSRLTLKPFDLSLNGSPVTLKAAADFSVRGWRYDWDFRAPNLDLAPIVDTFLPAYTGKVRGQLLAESAFRGSGLTGRGLKENLAGTMAVVSTNLNIDIAGLQDVKKQQAAALVSKPKTGVLSMLGQAFGGAGRGLSGSTPSWYQELSRSPLDKLVFRGQAQGGRFRVVEALIQSPVLRAQPSGDIAFGNTIQESIYNLPVALAVAGNVARQLRLTQDTNAYVALPPLLTIAGTVGRPDVRVDEVTLGTLLLKSGLPGALGEQLNKVTGGQSGAVVDRIGNVVDRITGKEPAPGTAAPGAPSTPESAPKRNPLDLLNTLKRPKPAPPAPPNPPTPPK